MHHRKVAIWKLLSSVKRLINDFNCGLKVHRGVSAFFHRHNFSMWFRSCIFYVFIVAFALYFNSIIFYVFIVVVSICFEEIAVYCSCMWWLWFMLTVFANGDIKVPCCARVCVQVVSFLIDHDNTIITSTRSIREATRSGKTEVYMKVSVTHFCHTLLSHDSSCFAQDDLTINPLVTLFVSFMPHTCNVYKLLGHARCPLSIFNICTWGCHALASDNTLRDTAMWYARSNECTVCYACPQCNCCCTTHTYTYTHTYT